MVGRRRGKVLSEDLREGSAVFTVTVVRDCVP